MAPIFVMGTPILLRLYIYIEYTPDSIHHDRICLIWNKDVWSPILQTIFKNGFSLNENKCIRIYSLISDWPCIIVSSNRLVPIWHDAIKWTINDPVDWRMYAVHVDMGVVVGGAVIAP